MEATVKISSLVDALRRRRAMGRATLRDCINLAKDTETLIGDIADAEGADSAKTCQLATAVASEMLNTVIDNINRRSQRLSDTLAEAWRVMAYIDLLPVTSEFATSRLLPQKEALVALMRRKGVVAKVYEPIYSPTLGDKGFYDKCSTRSSLTQYLHRHPNGTYIAQAQKRIAEIDRKEARKNQRKRNCLRAALFLATAALIYLVCWVLKLSTLVTIGVILLAAALVCVYAWARSASSDDASQHRSQWLAIGSAIAFSVAGTSLIFVSESIEQRQELNRIIAENDEDAIVEYLSSGINTYYADEALQAYLSIMDSIFLDPERMSRAAQIPPLARMAMFAQSPDISEQARQAIEKRLRLRTDSLYAEAAKVNNLDSWLKYQALAPSSLYYDSSEKIDSIEAACWSSEPTAWEAALRDNSRDAFNRYLDLFPSGAHARAASQRIIDLEVSDYRNQGRVTVDSISKILDTDGPTSRVIIYNNSDFDIKMLFSGPSSISWTIKAQSYDEMQIANGTYQVLAIVDNPQNDRFTFTQEIDHGVYSSSIEINSEK